MTDKHRASHVVGLDAREKLASEAFDAAPPVVGVETCIEAGDLQRELESIDQFRLKLGLKPIVDQGLAREPAVTSLIYVNLISSLEKDALEQAALSERTSSVINEFRSNKDAGQGGSTTSASTAFTP